MKRYTYLFAASIGFFLLACNNSETKKSAAVDMVEPVKDRYDLLRELDSRVKVEEVPATNVVSLEVIGGYQRHPEAYQQLVAYVSKNHRTVGAILGIYPHDPDLVEEDKLSWSISLRVLPGKPGAAPKRANEKDPFAVNATNGELGAPLSSFATPQKPFLLEQLPAVTAVTLRSDVARIGKDGLALNAWIDMNNYVQTGTARTEFGNATQESQLIPVKIIVPVKKRTKEAL